MAKVFFSSLRRAGIAVFFALALVPPDALASSSFDMETISELYHVTADRTLYHSREKVKEAFGHVVVSAQGKRLSCEYLWVNDVTRDIKARGNVVFVDKSSTVEAAEINFNMDTGIGAIFYGRVYNDLYSLRGQLIRRVGETHFLTTEGEYTTCKDCPESWKLAARNVDLTVDGYAFMDGVFVTIKDIPTLYLPYLVVPVKTKRQSGLLFPRIGASSSHGFVFVQPLFLTLGQHQDATLGFGTYSAQGLRYEGQHRYKSVNGIAGQTEIFYTHDRRYGDEPNRGAIKSQHEWPFAKNFGMRVRYFDIRDRDYSYDFSEDLNVQNLPALESNAVAQAPFDDFFLSAEARRYRNLIYDAATGFDGGMVQSTPTIHAGIKERPLAGPLLGSFYGRYDNFARTNGPFTDLNGNRIFDPVFSPDNTATDNPEFLREAHRYILSPEISAPFRLGRFFTFVPAVQYNTTHYSFKLPSPNAPLGSTSTTYLRYRFDMNTTFERVYDYDGEKVSKVKHQLTPFINFSYIPGDLGTLSDQNHPFQKQLLAANGLFDQFDVVPLTNSTNFLRFPQGRSIYYGFDSRVVRKLKKPSEMPRAYPYDLIPATKPKKYATPYNRKQELQIEDDQRWDEFNPNYELYQELWTFNASQAYDFLDARNHKSDPTRAFSYFLAKSSFSLDDSFQHNLEYRYYPRLVVRNLDTSESVYNGEQTVTTNLAWVWKRLQNFRHTRTFERSTTLGFAYNGNPSPSRSIDHALTWSFNDFVSLQTSYSYDLMAKKQKDWGANLQLTHPSECWGLLLHYDWKRSREPNYSQFGFEVLLNLTGNGFLGSKNGGSSGGAPGAFSGI